MYINKLSAYCTSGHVYNEYIINVNIFRTVFTFCIVERHYGADFKWH